MPGNFTSSEVVAGNDILDTDLNSRRDDILVNAGDYATSTGSANAYVLAVSSDMPVYAAGQVFKFNANFANTGATTIAVNGQAAKNILKDHDVALEANDIESGQLVIIMYDGTQFQMLSQKGVDISSASKATLTAGVTSNASALHNHNDQVTNYNFTVFSNHDDPLVAGTGFSDATIKLLSIADWDSTQADSGQWKISFSNDVGAAFQVSAFVDYTTVNVNLFGILHIGTDVWTSETVAAPSKNGTAVTVSGTGPTAQGIYGHDSTNSYLLICDATNRIRRYSGIAWTTITYVDSITLDTVVSNYANSIGFVYDNTNQRYICIDTTNNLLRRFDSAGTTIDTVAYTVDDTNIEGLCFIKDRIYLVELQNINYSTNLSGYFVNLIPTAMTR